MAEQRPRIMYFKEYLPTPVCVALSMFFALVFQFNGGVFLPTAVQMSSALGCIQEDVMMAGYASMTGLTMARDVGSVHFELDDAGRGLFYT